VSSSPEITLTASPFAWRPRLPADYKRTVPSGESFFAVREALRSGGLATVCEEALCPNRTDCWARGTLTFQILWTVCTRRCPFCAEETGKPAPPDKDEPRRIAEAARALGLRHVVLTSPARDDLSDQGAGHFAACIAALRRTVPNAALETLAPDFQDQPEALRILFDARPDVYNHNVETVRRLTPAVRARATYDRSLSVLRKAAEAGLVAKSGLMVGLGETADELLETFRDLRQAGVRLLTVGQYLPPGPKHLRVEKFYSSEDFVRLREMAEGLFDKTMIGPLVRSSYHADKLGPVR
jgi:lipoyl synthase